MKRRKRNPRQLSLFAPAIGRSELSPDVRQKLVDQVAQLLVQANPSTTEQTKPPSVTRHETFRTQENHHAPQ
jgi:hypothetical protein